HLPFLEIVADNGTLISSAQWPARFGYMEPWVREFSDWNAQPAFLAREELPDGPVLALVAVRTVRVADKTLYLIGGQPVDREFLSSIVLPEGTRLMLYTGVGTPFNPAALAVSPGELKDAGKLAPIIAQVEQKPAETWSTIAWSSGAADRETIHALPLQGRDGELLAVLLLGSSRREVAELNSHIRSIALLVGGGAILLGILFSTWLASRVTRPVEELAEASRRVAAGDWEAHVENESRDELGQLADSFNTMTRQLVEQRGRLVQAERVAAWRELARRLAHELKNPLFPLQITVENLLRARQAPPADFDEVFRESTTTLLAEINNLKAIVGRFSDFAKMPRPELRTVAVNDLVREVARVFQAQLAAPDRPKVALDLQLGDPPDVLADRDLLHRALSNLMLNALDAMPQGGSLTIRTQAREGGVRIEISDTGSGLTQEECDRLFTPYYTTKQHGTGLGLAIVQSVVSDHGGRISVRSAPGGGTTFSIDLLREPATDAARGTHA
ncbi:MAG TPA: ATP-binding protein, partial [Rudaea sp.]|nr:ATP-binding protein [Rudaea sp.]